MPTLFRHNGDPPQTPNETVLPNDMPTTVWGVTVESGHVLSAMTFRVLGRADFARALFMLQHTKFDIDKHHDHAAGV